AHPWLAGPQDSYLGYWRRGGGASGEHSHALNLWQHFAHVVGAGRVAEVSAMMSYVEDGPAVYDDVCFLTLRTETGLVGRVARGCGPGATGEAGAPSGRGGRAGGGQRVRRGACPRNCPPRGPRRRGSRDPKEAPRRLHRGAEAYPHPGGGPRRAVEHQPDPR